MIRNIAFQAAYWLTSIVFAILAMPLVALPNRKPMMGWIGLYTKTMVFWMRMLAGIKIVFRGVENIPEGSCVIAAKHQSWGDGIAMFSQFSDLAFVTGDHLEKMPLLGAILRKMGAIVVDNCGGAYARARLVDTELKKARDAGRRILIYPEGHLSEVGRHHRYRKGVYHMYTAYDKPVVPVATNLGLFWPQQTWKLTPGEAVIAFLDPIAPGMGKAEFMAHLQDTIESASIDLLPDDFPLPDERLQTQPSTPGASKTPQTAKDTHPASTPAAGE